MFESILNKKILITGSRSRVALRIKEMAEKYKIKTIGVNRSIENESEFAVDITHREKLFKLIDREAPDMIIHTAALTNVDLCERDQELARRINVVGSENVAYSARHVNAKLINLSTDYVFNGEHGPYGEDGVPSPINYYGVTKLEAENKIHLICKNAVTIRTCVPYDWNDSAPPNFLMWVVKTIQSREKIRIVQDQWNTPTYTPHLAEIILKVCAKDFQGLIHVSGKDYLSRFDFALKIAREFKLDEKLIEPVETKCLSQDAARPNHAGLKVKAVESLLGEPMLTVMEGIGYCRERHGYHSAP